MPVIPVIQGKIVADGGREANSNLFFMRRQEQGVESRPRYKDGQYHITPSTLSFLCPLFLILIIGPLIIFFFVRRRRRHQAMQAIVAEMRARPTTKKTISISHEEARARLADAAEIVSADEKKGVPLKGEERRIVVVRTVEKGGVDVEEGEETVSLGERECAICLSTLSTPTTPLSTPPTLSPPAPAKLAAPPSTYSCSNESTKTSPIVKSTVIPNPTDKEKDAEDDEEEGHILRLKTCHHEFHDSCLLNWCVLGKVSCPICRAVFSESREPEGEGERAGGDGEGRSQNSRNENGRSTAR